MTAHAAILAQFLEVWRLYKVWQSKEEQDHPERFAWRQSLQHVADLLKGAKVLDCPITFSEGAEVDGFSRSLLLRLELEDGQKVELQIECGEPRNLSEEQYNDELWSSEGAGLAIQLDESGNLEPIVDRFVMPAFDGWPGIDQ